VHTPSLLFATTQYPTLASRWLQTRTSPQPATTPSLQGGQTVARSVLELGQKVYPVGHHSGNIKCIGQSC